MPSRFYLLHGKRAVECDAETSIGWRMYNASACVVARERVGDSVVSTVFLGINNEAGYGAPMIFETKVIGGPLDGTLDRYPTWDIAETGHRSMVVRVYAAANE